MTIYKVTVQLHSYVHDIVTFELSTGTIYHVCILE